MNIVTPEMTKALNKAKVGLMCSTDGVFLSTVMLGLQHQWDFTCPTACTNGRYIKYGPEYFMNQTAAVRMAIIAHETWHVILMHMIRVKLRQKARYNMAGDYVINLMIDQAGFKLGQGWLLDQQYIGMSTEQVYDLLPESDASSYSMSGDLEPADPNDTTLPGDIEDMIIQAAIQSKAANQYGSIPGHLRVFIDELLNPVIPWYKHFSPFLTKLIRTGYNYNKPNRRYRPKFILPTPLSSGLCDIAIAADISGSTEEFFPQFIGETAAILSNFRPDNIHFLTFDTKIQAEENLKNLRDLARVEFTGLGGTFVDPVLQWAVDNNPNVLIIFTDGYYDTPNIKPQCPVIWVVCNHPQYVPPFGKLIHFTVAGA